MFAEIETCRKLMPTVMQLQIYIHCVCRWSLIAGRLPGRTDNENMKSRIIGAPTLENKKLQDHHQSPSSSTACTRKTLNQCQEKPKLGSKKFIAKTDSYPIRTRASKRTKALFFSTPEQEKSYGQDQVINCGACAING
ncbi:hypothetical protein WN943_021983 [Citrus x changshan-huyou]